MNCVNCGAPLQLADGRTVLTCIYCRSMRLLDAFIDDGDRVVSLDRPADLDCPRCQRNLDQAAMDGKPASYCPDCRGILLETAIFGDVASKRRATFRGPEIPPRPIDPELLQQIVDCPKCQLPMDVHPHYGPGQAVIDSCHRCNLVWLDHAEMTNLERTPGRR